MSTPNRPTSCDLPKEFNSSKAEVKTHYYVILARPQGSQTWTPLPISQEENGAGNFFASAIKAQSWLTNCAKPWHRKVFLSGPQIEVENEFKIGRVVTDE